MIQNWTDHQIYADINAHFEHHVIGYWHIKDKLDCDYCDYWLRKPGDGPVMYTSHRPCGAWIYNNNVIGFRNCEWYVYYRVVDLIGRLL